MTENIISDFGEFIRLNAARGAPSAATIRAYLGHARQHLEWCAERGVNLASASPEELVVYRSWLATLYAPATVATKLTALRHLYAMAQARGYRPDNPAAGLASPRDRTVAADRAKFLPLEGLKRILDAPGPPHTAIASRDRAILALMGVHGLRVGEVAGLNVGDVDLDAGAVTVRGKGNKTRMIYLIDFSRRRIEAWLEARREIAADGEDALFVAMDRARRFWGRRMTARGIEALTNRYLEREGLKRPGISCHSLRHSAAVWARASGASIDGLADMLGHSSVDTSRIYAQIVRRMEENPARYLEAALETELETE